MHQVYRRLYRSREDTQLTGVCGGIGRYFSVDPVLVRLTWVIATLLTGIVPGVLGYLLAWFIVPAEPPALATPAPAEPQAPPEADPSPTP